MSSNTSDISSSLLSLSIAAASAARIPVSSSVDTTTSETSAITATTAGAAATTNSFTPGSYNGPSSLPSSSSGNVNIASAKLHGGMPKHRRMSSTGLTKRRLSDAREAAARPSAVTIQTAAAALSSLATLSLSSSPPPPTSSLTHPSLLSATLQQIPHTSTSAVSATRSASSSPLSSSNAAIGAPQSFATAASGLIARSRSSDGSASSVAPLDGSGSVKEEDEDKDNSSNPNPSTNGEVSVGGGISIRSATGKKRGTIFKCESCSKVYRHPSCLIKHRWEHSPHWREASKFLLSKHQQVQLLEAAAILSHISPSATGGTSLPEDRSLWPSFLSGGLLPPPTASNITSPTNGTGNVSTNATSSPRPGSSSSLDANPTYPISSSVPSAGMTRSTSTGPRLYDYSIVNGGAGGITHVRPGVLGVPTGPSPPAHASSEEAMGVTASGMTRAVPMPINVNNTHSHSFGPNQFGSGYGNARESTGAFSYMSGNSSVDSWGSPGGSVGISVLTHAQSSSLRSSAYEGPSSGVGLGGSEHVGGDGGISLPRSSVRSFGAASTSISGDSRSRSRSGSADDVDVDGDVDVHARGRSVDIEMDMRDQKEGEVEVVGDLDMDEPEGGIGIRIPVAVSARGRYYPTFQQRSQAKFGYGARGRISRMRGWEEEDVDVDAFDVVREERELSVHEEKEEWDGEMDMEM